MPSSGLGRDHQRIENTTEGREWGAAGRQAAPAPCPRGAEGPPWFVERALRALGWHDEPGSGARPDAPHSTWRESAPDAAQRRPAGPPWLAGGHPHRWRGPRDNGPLRRAMNERVLGGVAAGLARRVGVDRTVVRSALVLSTLLGGVGIAAYALAWLFLPVEGEEHGAASRAISDRRGLAMALALVPLLVLTLLVASVLGASWLTTISWPLFIAAGAMVLLWRNVSDEERQVLAVTLGPVVELITPGHRSWRNVVVRAAIGLAGAAGGVVLLTHGQRDPGLVRPLMGIVLFGASMLVVFGPWWLRLARNLVGERQARARAEERSEVAARVHDSVLQTLALIQRRAGDPHEVVKLARQQERELRGWLFGGRVPGTLGGDGGLLSVAIEALQRDVEELHGVPVEAVVVGDAPLDDDLGALLEAGREAVVNAAKWSGAPVVSVFVEVDEAEVAMYVRDRGRGFVEAAVAPDRRGLAESVRARMARRGGGAEIRTAPGEGTEVTLRMPRR
ncbi:MAG TPA: PspC domain-containing protein [Acidimicrobiales bacterium]|nr:PspC domain-containing protein [Acidimicrobiales bacterium]